jgi:hypothetical protein
MFVACSSISLAGQVTDLTLTLESSCAKGGMRIRRQRVQGLVPARSLRVSLNSISSIPQDWGIKGVQEGL